MISRKMNLTAGINNFICRTKVKRRLHSKHDRNKRFEFLAREINELLHDSWWFCFIDDRLSLIVKEKEKKNVHSIVQANLFNGYRAFHMLFSGKGPILLFPSLSFVVINLSGELYFLNKRIQMAIYVKHTCLHFIYSHYILSRCSYWIWKLYIIWSKIV